MTSWRLAIECVISGNADPDLSTLRFKQMKIHTTQSMQPDQKSSQSFNFTKLVHGTPKTRLS